MKTKIFKKILPIIISVLFLLSVCFTFIFSFSGNNVSASADEEDSVISKGVYTLDVDSSDIYDNFRIDSPFLLSDPFGSSYLCTDIRFEFSSIGLDYLYATVVYNVSLNMPENDSYYQVNFHSSITFYSDFSPSSCSAADIDWFLSHTVYSPFVDSDYQNGYSDGHSAGLIDGYDSGFYAGKEFGYNLGYNDGYSLGQSEQITFNPISQFLTPVHDFLNTKLFGSITIGSMFNIVLFVAVALIFIKMFSGG